MADDSCSTSREGFVACPRCEDLCCDDDPPLTCYLCDCAEWPLCHVPVLLAIEYRLVHPRDKVPSRLNRNLSDYYEHIDIVIAMNNAAGGRANK